MDREGMTILLVEDNPGDARIIKELVAETSGAPIVLHQVDRLAGAVEFLSRDAVELILLDLSLPDSRGIHSFREIHHAAPETAIIILTGLNDEELAMRAMQEGAQDYLIKGCAVEGLLIRAMHYAIERKKAEVALRKAHDSLEARVQTRTAELARINDELRNEIVERTRVERALRASEARYRAVVEDQTELIFRILADQTLTFVNGAFGRFLSRKPQELLGKNLRDLVSEAEAGQIREHLSVLTETGTVRIAEQLLHTPEAGLRWVQWTIRLIPDSSHDTPEYQWVGRDITKQKTMEEALQKSACDMKRFAYFVAHDLKGPAVGLHGLVRLLEESSAAGLDERGKSYCRRISRSAEQIVALVESINLYISTKESPLLVEEVSPAKDHNEV